MSNNVNATVLAASFATSVLATLTSKAILNNWQNMPFWSQWLISIVAGLFIFALVILMFKKSKAELPDERGTSIGTDIKGSGVNVKGVDVTRNGQGHTRIAKNIEAGKDVNIENIKVN